MVMDVVFVSVCGYDIGIPVLKQLVRKFHRRDSFMLDKLMNISYSMTDVN